MPFTLQSEIMNNKKQPIPSDDTGMCMVYTSDLI